MLQKTDCAEICELVGLYLLSQLEDFIINGSVTVYRDDSLAVGHKYSGPQMDRLRNLYHRLFQTTRFSDHY